MTQEPPQVPPEEPLPVPSQVPPEQQALVPAQVPQPELQTISSDQQMWRILAHASAFIQVIGIPSLVGPLVVWLIKREDPAVEPHALAALNFQLSLLIYTIGGIVLAVLAAITIVGLVLTALIVFFLVALLILELVFALMASIAASKGELYAYPMSLNLIKG
jgi:hypothetical protein